MPFNLNSLKIKFTLGALLAILLIMLGGMFNYHRVQKEVSQAEILNRIASVSSFSEASRDYVRNVLRPELSKHFDGMILEGMSSTFVTRSILEDFARRQPGYTFKQPTLNPLNPINLANAFEAQLIARFQQEPDLTEISEFQGNGPEKIFFTARPIHVEPDCLKCHGDPALAPKEIIERYGKESGFFWKTDEIVSVLMISVPAADIEAYQQSLFNTTLRTFTLLTLILCLAIYFLFDRLVARRIEHACSVMDKVSDHLEPKGRINDPSNDELGQMGQSFNRMAESLEGLRNSLEEKVALRTRELAEKNREIDNNRKRIQQALDQISSLIKDVTEQKQFGIYFQAVEQRCWETNNCTNTECPCHGKEPLECWKEREKSIKMVGDSTVCGRKDISCIDCQFYQDIQNDPVLLIGQQFNSMMHILEEKNSELTNAYAQLQASQAQMLQREKMASIGQLAAGVAHEINNPLGFITSNIKSLERNVTRILDYLRALESRFNEDGPPITQQEIKELRNRYKIDFISDDLGPLFNESLEGSERVKDIVQGLRSFSRIDSQGKSMADINTCLDETLRIIWNELKHKAEVRKDYGKLPELLCHAQQLNQVFLNLLINAAQAIDTQGTITISTRQQDDAIVIKIADTGKGIPTETISRIFEPFYTTKDVGKGTGLGLSIAYDIIKKHNGHIEATSETERGTTFTITLPVQQNEDGGGDGDRNG